jgi:hypothetical protein
MDKSVYFFVVFLRSFTGLTLPRKEVAMGSKFPLGIGDAVYWLEEDWENNVLRVRGGILKALVTRNGVSHATVYTVSPDGELSDTVNLSVCCLHPAWQLDEMRQLHLRS